MKKSRRYIKEREREEERRKKKVNGNLLAWKKLENISLDFYS